MSETFVDDAGTAAALLADLIHAARGTTRPEPVERAAVLYLDPNRRLLGRSDFAGTTEAVAPPFRTIVAEALRLDATAMVLGHTHPRGDPRPSPADLSYTRELSRIAAALEITLLDHLILADSGFVSLREAGLM